MTRTQYYTATSVDGFIADPDNSLSWLLDLPQSPDRIRRFDAFSAGVGVMVMGSTTYAWIVVTTKTC